MSFRDFVPRQRFQPTVAVSPDGEQVAFSMNASGQFDLWVAQLDGSSPPRSITTFTERSVRSVAWSPDGETIAFGADSGGDEQHQIHLVSVAGGEPRRVTTADDRQHDLGDQPFSADGRFLAYSANDRDPAVQDLVVHDLGSGEYQRVESIDGLLLVPVEFSSDGTHLLVLGARSNTDSDACVVDMTRETPTLDLVTAHDGDVKNVPVGWIDGGSGLLLMTDGGGEYTGVQVFDLGSRTTSPFQPVSGSDWDVEHVATSTDASTVVWTVNEAGVSALYRHRGGATERVDVGMSVVTSLAVTPDGRHAVMLLSAATRPTDLVVVDLGGDDEPRYLTDSRPSAVDITEQIEPDLVEFSSHDGRSVPGWLYRPAGDGPFPVVLSIHGGPEAQERPGYAYAGLYQYLLAAGVGVFAPNVRGSTGYGRRYQTLIHRDWGGAELGDFEYANRYLHGVPWVDGERIAVFGGSFGGFATLSCVSRLPHLWAAGVSVVGPSNLHTFVQSVPPTWRSLMASWVGDPEHDAELLTERSPLTYADDIVVPLMVIQGANDPRVAQAESDQIVESLRSRGVEVRYDVYDDEGHGFTTRENEITALGDVGDFLITHLTDG